MIYVSVYHGIEDRNFLVAGLGKIARDIIINIGGFSVDVELEVG